MKKISLAILFATTLLSTGCSMMGANSPEAMKSNFVKLDCDSIKQVVESYKTSMSMADSSKDMLTAIGMDGVASDAKAKAKETYELAVSVARPIAKAKQCKFVL